MAQLRYKDEEYGAPASATTLVIEGLAAVALIKDEGFRGNWAALQAECPWATSFQGCDFVTTWYRVYVDLYSPIIVRQVDTTGALVGLLTLATQHDNGELVVAGAHQAEYHGWLARPEDGDGFISQALDLLRRNYPYATLTFKFLPPDIPVGWLASPSPWSGLALKRHHKRPLIEFGDGASIAASLKKKSNKSRINRLKRLGELEFRELHTPGEFDSVIDQIADQYDFRQGAINASVPFREDPLKKTFLRELMQHPGVLHISALMLEDAPIAAVIANCEKDTVSVGVFSHSPFYAKHSPGKFHLLFLGAALSEQGFTSLDLTPGGAWKDRFATTFDEVLEVTVHFSNVVARRGRWAVAFEAVASKFLKWVSIKPETIRALPAELEKVTADKIMQRVRRWLWDTQEFRLYSMDIKTAGTARAEPTMSVNCLGDLLRFAPSEDWQTRDTFLSQALCRLEDGDRVYSVSDENALLHSGWASDHVKESYFTEVGQTYEYPSGSSVFYDFYTSPKSRGQGLYQKSLGQMLQESAQCEGIEKVFISVLADNAASRHVIEKRGFKFQNSFYRTVRLGMERRWTDHSNHGSQESRR